MSKVIAKLPDEFVGLTTDERESIESQLEKKCPGYVLITLSEPNKKNELEVQMSHQGDNVLVQYLLENALSVIENT